MAHELDRKANGVAAMFSVRTTPWHKEGTVLTEAPSFDEALRVGGLDYEVALRPLMYQPSSEEHRRRGLGPICTGSGFAVVRVDREGQDGAVLSVVGDAYQVLQNREAFEVLEPLIDSGVALLQTGGALREDRDAWLLVKFDIKDAVVQEVFADKVVPFAIVHTSHGLRRVTIMETPIEVVCANTLSAAYRSQKGRETAVGIVHRGDARTRLVDAAEAMFGGLVERYRGIAERYAALRERILTVQEFVDAVLDVAAPYPERGPQQTRQSHDHAIARAQERREALVTAWERGTGHKGDHSAWEALSGIAEAMDYDDEHFKVKTSRVESLMSGTLADKKDEVAAALVALCARK